MLVADPETCAGRAKKYKIYAAAFINHIFLNLFLPKRERVLDPLLLGVQYGR